MKPKSPASFLGGLSWQDVVKYGVAIIGLAFGYGRLMSDVAATREKVGRMEGRLEKLYDRVAWGVNDKNVGPPPPVE